MTPAVSYPVHERLVDEGQERAWINEEARQLLRQLREAVNATSPFRKTAVTDGAGTYQRVWTSETLPTNAAWQVVAYVVLCAASGTFQAAGYTLAATFRSSAGTVAQVGATTSTHSAESAAAIDARFAVDAANRVVYLEARDDAASPMNVTATIQVVEAVQ